MSHHRHTPLPSVHMLVSLLIVFSLITAFVWITTEATEPDYRQQAVEGCNEYFGKGNWSFINITEEVEGQSIDSQTWICRGSKSGEYYEPMLVIPF